MKTCIILRELLVIRYKKLGIKKRSDVNERAFLIPNFLKNYLKRTELQTTFTNVD